jgi:transcriptional regulator with PAS, ATPase and Fis domain
MNEISYTLSRSALVKLMQHHWAGNIRELRNSLQLAAGLCTNNIIEDTNIYFSEIRQSAEAVIPPEKTTTKADISNNDQLNPIDKLEWGFITELLNKYNGNRKQIAAEMNISERTLYRKLKRLNLNNPVLS